MKTAFLAAYHVTERGETAIAGRLTMADLRGHRLVGLLSRLAIGEWDGREGRDWRICQDVDNPRTACPCYVIRCNNGLRVETDRIVIRPEQESPMT